MCLDDVYYNATSGCSDSWMSTTTDFVVRPLTSCGSTSCDFTYLRDPYNTHTISRSIIVPFDAKVYDAVTGNHFTEKVDVQFHIESQEFVYDIDYGFSNRLSLRLSHSSPVGSIEDMMSEIERRTGVQVYQIRGEISYGTESGSNPFLDDYKNKNYVYYLDFDFSEINIDDFYTKLIDGYGIYKSVNLNLKTPRVRKALLEYQLKLIEQLELSQSLKLSNYKENNAGILLSKHTIGRDDYFLNNLRKIERVQKELKVIKDLKKQVKSGHLLNLQDPRKKS